MNGNDEMSKASGVSDTVICKYDESMHLDRLRECLVELQDFERRLDPRMPPGCDIVDEYVPRMLDRCIECDGKVLIAEVDHEVAGFVTILTKVTSTELEDGDVEYGLVSDLMVRKSFRARGLGRKLLEEAESFARANGVKWLRIGVLADNQAADNLYSSMGFAGLYIEREKDLRT